MQTRLLGLMLLTGCYVPLSAPEATEDRAERSTHEASEAAPQCSDLSCSPSAMREESKASSSHVRTLKVEPSKPQNQSLGITISLPAETVDCSDVLLAVVGAKRAVLGAQVVLEAAASGPTGDQDASTPMLLWKSEDTEVTVIGPASAEVSCDTSGVHTISVELAPPAPCPATVHVEVECIEKG